ncbi:MAG: AAA family ATPase [Deltaproteobacteria bacterium]|nr:AAA family ATPase [Deltaproteobacteria bacterium]
MYKSYWGLELKPFENTPDPRFFYTSAQHEEALTRLIYGVRESKGAVMLTGVFGCGKTLLSQVLLGELDRDVYRVAMIQNPMLTSVELLRSIAVRLGATGLPTLKTEILKDVLLDTISELLLENYNDGKQSVILLDEMHVIEDKMIFEDLRMLLNNQLQDHFLCTLIFMGQPELRKHIEVNKQLNQRIAIRYHVDAFDLENTIAYIRHRMKVAGAQRDIFEETALSLIFQKSGGIPRRINQICDMSLFIGSSHEFSTVTPALVTDAAKSLEG